MFSLYVVVGLLSSLVVSAAPLASDNSGDNAGRLSLCRVDDLKLVLPAVVAADLVFASDVKPVHVLLGRGVQVSWLPD